MKITGDWFKREPGTRTLMYYKSESWISVVVFELCQGESTFCNAVRRLRYLILPAQTKCIYYIYTRGAKRHRFFACLSPNSCVIERVQNCCIQLDIIIMMQLHQIQSYAVNSPYPFYFFICYKHNAYTPIIKERKDSFRNKSASIHTISSIIKKKYRDNYFVVLWKK